MAGACAQTGRSVRQRQARQDIQIAQPRVVHVRVFDRPPALDGNVERQAAEVVVPQHATPSSLNATGFLTFERSLRCRDT
jgi:hypothetical protein